jgi:hypothetical protein
MKIYALILRETNGVDCWDDSLLGIFSSHDKAECAEIGLIVKDDFDNTSQLSIKEFELDELV